MKDRITRRRTLLIAVMLLMGGMAQAQVTIKGDVYGGGWQGKVKNPSTTIVGNTSVTINGGTAEGSVYGGGKGLNTDEKSGLVEGNTRVSMTGGVVQRSIYGGGELGSVGTFTDSTLVSYTEGNNAGQSVYVPKTCKEGTGFVQVLMEGGQVGLRGSTMPDADSNPDDDDRGWIFTGCKGEADSINYHKAIALGVVDSTYLEIKGGVITASVYGGCENGLVLRSTNVKIEGGQIGTGYRGNNGWDDPYTEAQWTAAKTAVTNGTMGTSSYVNPFHECDAWPFGETVNNVIQYNVYDIFYDSTWVNEAGDTVTYKPENTAEHGSNGQTFFGKVFGGGSGFYPIAPGVWRRSAGQVRKDTYVEITGGHILTSVYGGNETTDVLGTAHVKMTGGTLGVPRDSASIVRHPVTCYLFGAGMGDPRVLFNTWTNVENVDVEVSGDAFVFGSVFGGGEEGHVLADVDLTIKGNAHIGTLGYSYVEGNVFGGGRGFSGEALTAGTVGGNVEVNIEGGTMLGSIYGGGRLASVGTFFTDPESDGYGHFQDGPNHGYTTVNISGGRIGNNYEDLLHPADHTKGGNVYGGSMGRVTLLDGTTENHLWPRLAQVKQSRVNITTGDSNNPPVILGNVYGGCEFGSVRDSATVVLNAEGAMVHKIFGGGYGSSSILQTPVNDSTAQPAALAGRVMGNTLVEVKNGTVEMSVYGGGEFASVGRVVGTNETLINGIANVIVSGGTIGNDQMYLPDPDPTPDPDPDPTPDPNPVGTRSDYVLHVDHSGHVFGGGQGIANDINETYKDYCNVNHTRVTIKGGRVYGSVFGGGAESHVMGNDSVFIHRGANIGTIGTTAWDGNIFGGGKGNGYMVASREDGDGDEGGDGGDGGEGGDDEDEEEEQVFVASKTVGRVGGNTYINMDGGTILGSIFGGGRLGITGIRGIDANGDFDLYLDANGKYDSINHGRATIKVFGKASVVDNDTVYSTVIGTNQYEALLKSDESVGDIFGSGKGDVDYYDDIYAGRVANTKVTVTGSPRIHGSIFGGGEMASLGYWKKTDEYYENSGFSEVTVGKQNTADTLILGTYKEFTYHAADNPGNWTVYDTIDNVVTISHTATGNIYGGCQGDVDTEAPHWISMGRANGTKVNVHGGHILCSVFGGGEQGFVLGNTEVNVTGGTIGQELKSDILNATTHEVTGQGHYHLGSIFGGGYGTTITELHSNDSLGNNQANAVKWAGRVYGNTEVNFSGGQVYANVYGGGDLASVGRYRATIGGQSGDSLIDYVPVAGTGHCKVNISNTAYVGHYEEGSYGFVFGGGKGVGNDADRDFDLYCNVNTTEVVANLAYSNDNDASNDGRVGGSIFGGSPYGHVLDSTYVELKNGIIGTTGYSAYDGHVFGGGWGDKSNFDPDKRQFASGRVGGTTYVKMTGGTALGCLYGGGLIAMTGVGVGGSFDTYHNAAHEYDSINHGRAKVEITGGCVGDSINHSTFLLSDEKCGNVYGGGRGDVDDYIEDDFARMANAIVSISGSPVICGSVYGGGQMANVGYWNDYVSWYSEGTGDIRVTISGTPKIGTQLEFDHDNYAIVDPQLQKTVYDTIDGVRRISHTRTGNVFGGGQGDMRIRNGEAEGFEQGHCERTEVNISGNPVIRSSVYGGSEQGAIWGDTKVNISGGTIGTQGIKSDSLKFETDHWVVSNNHATYSFGSVYGGSYGEDSYKHLHNNSQAIADTVIGYAGRVYGNTKVTITGGQVYENVFGGGNLASVGEFSKVMGGQNDDVLIGLTPKANTGHCEVNVSGSAIVGPLDYTGLNAYVYGGGKGVGDDPSNLYKTYCNVNSAAVTVDLTYDNPDDGWNEETDGRVYGSLFGGGSDAHTLGDVSVTLNGGLIGTEGFTSYDGNIFGGGRNYLRHNYTAGRVGGNTTVEMTNGQIMGNIFGGGRIALTGADVNGALQSGNDVGNTKVMVKGGTVGNNTSTNNTADPNEIVVETFADYSMGSVYGGGMGHIDGIIGHPRASALLVANVKNTEVEISDDLGNNTHIYGIVYGGGEVSNVGSYSFVNEVVNNEAHIHSIDTVAGTGLAKVTISGGIIGGDRSQMRYALADGTYWPLYNDDLGYVYGGGKGISDNPNDYPTVYEGDYGDESNATSLINLMGTVIHTEVTVSEAAGRRTWVKGSVFGGSEAGHVMGNTLVTISGGQIGAGYSQTGVDLHYDEGQFINPVTTAITNDNALQGTVHWDFGRVVEGETVYASFDLVDLSNGILPSDGKSWFGNVFGGGSGWFPYVENPGTAQAHCSWNPICGKVWGNTHVVVEGGHILNNVYGGNESTDVGGKTLVEIKGGTVGVPRTKQQIIDLPTLGYVFGGGCGDPRTIFDNINNVDSTKVIVTGGTIYGSVYGGAEDGHVLGDTRVSVSGNSTIIGCKGLSTADGNIFGGGRNYLGENNKAGRVGGNINIAMGGGTIQGSIFGGGRLALSGVNADGEFPTTDWPVADHGNVTINVSGGEIGNGSDQGIHLLTESNESVGDIFGSGKGDTKNYMDTLAGRVTNTTITLTGSPRIHGAVFGGGEMASIGWWSPTTHAYYENTGAANITIGREGENDNPIIGTYLELNSTYLNDQYTVGETQYNHSPWTMIETVNSAERVYHTCTGNVFGGCQGDVDFEDWDDEPNHWPYMGRSRTSNITVNGGTIIGGVFGGAEQGTLMENTHVTINGGTIGSLVTDSNNEVYNFGGVYGAGYGSDDPTEDDHAITLYGVNTTTKMVAGRVYGNTLVDVLGGLINGDVFGGASFAYVGDYLSRTESGVKGNTRVNIGRLVQAPTPTRDTVPQGNATIKGMVFGANNHSGTPYGNATVHVYRTAHTSNPNNACPTIPQDADSDWLADQDQDEENFALKAVFGGSNNADYTPMAGCNDTVHVYFCEENTIWEVYGGSNAAAIGPSINTTNGKVNSYVIIDGGHIKRVFGGGNGASGISADIHGSANTLINGGLIHELYGGSNTLGLIDETNLTVNDEGECRVIIGDGYGSNNESLVVGDVITTLNCDAAGGGTYANFYGGANLATIYGNVTVNVMGGTYTNIFGGSKGRLDNDETEGVDESFSADIKGFPADEEGIAALPDDHQEAVRAYLQNNPNAYGTGGKVTLNIYGGTIENAFGGSDILGAIDSLIMVNVIDTVTYCPLQLTNVYGAGRNTVYQPKTLSNGQTITSPIVNVIHGEVLGSVYGGGYGATATTYANPVVRIGYDADAMADVIEPFIDPAVLFNFDTASATVGGSVYGGGNLANVTGNPTVNVMKGNTVVSGSVYGGGSGDWNDINLAKVVGNDTVRIGDGLILRNVFGGGNMGSVTGNTWVEMTGGEIGEMSVYQIEDETGHILDSIIPDLGIPAYELNGGYLFGGGQGSQYDGKDFGHVGGNTYVNVSGNAKIHNCVFGGGKMGSVGSGQLDNKNTGVATVTISGGEIGPLTGTGLNAYVYGGGQGMSNDPPGAYALWTNVDSTSVIVSDSARIYGSIFGGGSDGHVLGNVSVLVEKGTNTNNKIPVVGTNGLTTWDGNIFGGGRNYMHTNTTAGRVGGNIVINMTGGELKGNLYGGGRLGSVGMKSDGTMYGVSDADHGNVFVNVKGNAVVGIAGRDTRTSGTVLGGGRGLESDTDNTLAKVNNTYVDISESARIYQHVLGGAAYGSVLKDTHVTIKGGEIGEMIETVNPDDETVTKSHKGGDVYGGGSGYAPTGLATAADYLPYANIGIVKGDTYVTVKNGTMRGIVYGGGEVASVGTYTTDQEGTTTLAANTGATNVVVKGGTIGPLDGSGMNGYVFGGSEGVELDANAYYKYHATVGSTNVTIDSVAIVYGSVLGGGADGHVWNSTSVTVRGGTIGTDGYSLGDGCVFGGGGNKAMSNNSAGRVGGNINIAISQPVNERPTLIKGNVYGGGYAGISGVNEHGSAYTSDLGNHGNVTIAISGGTVGTDEAIAAQFVGNVFGSGKGDLAEDHDHFGATQSTDVTISNTARILGNVYGGGEVAHVERNTTVNIEGGTVGVLDYVHKVDTDDDQPLDSIVHVNNTGNVFGGGRGHESSAKVAQVKGNAMVNISGGHVYFNAYGGGEMAGVGEVEFVLDDEDNIIDLLPDANTGYTKVKVTGGQVGPAPKVDLEHGYNIPIGLNGLDGYVFGGGKGIGDDPITPSHPYGKYYNLANVNYACVEVNIPANADIKTNRIWGSLFGGAEDGHVLGSDTVKLVSGIIGTDGTTSYDGNIFGGGRNFHKKNYTAGRTRGNITVEMSGGQLFGSLFGGGRLAITGIDLRGNIVPDVTGDNPEKFGYVNVKVSGGKVGNDTPIEVNGTTMPFIENFTKYSMGEVFGGGKGDMKGIEGHPAASALLISLVKNTEVEITGTAKIYGSVYGGGEVANVGQFHWDQNSANLAISNIQLTGGGHSKVTVSGGQIGADRMKMDYTLVGGDGADKYNLRYNTDVGHVCGGGKGIVDNPNRLVPGTSTLYYGTANVIYHGENAAHDESVLDVMATVNTTEVIIKDNAFVKGGVYGGSMNGHVLDSTYVLMSGGQIGSGKTAAGVDEAIYTTFVDPNTATVSSSLAPTVHWEFGHDYTINGQTVKRYDPFDPVDVFNGIVPSDGRTWFGNVYGGGSGYYPYIVRNHNNTADSTVWNRNAGMVRGNTRVEMTGGHVLSSVYGGSETTDVLGTATVILNGSDANDNTKLTVGVPRIANDVSALPLPGYVYGSGNGDPRTNFNTWTNVDSTYVQFNNGVIYGSVFGGGMDGHVLRNTHVEVLGGTIGIFGTTGAEGNVFGGGRGSNPVALTAGGVGGNTQVDIKNGRMLGSIFGGGNNGSVGIQFTAPDDDDYGEILDDEATMKHGYTLVNITGGVIGHGDTGGRTGGNVYGGSRGSAGAPGTIAQRMAKVKQTEVNIRETTADKTFIMGSVFGSGEDGHVLKDTYVNVYGGQIGGESYATTGDPTPCSDTYHGNVYGGGRGLSTYTDNNGQQVHSITAGLVGGNTNVTVYGGRIVRSVYGGGNLASVGNATETADASGNYHTGLATVNILGGTIGFDGEGNAEHYDYRDFGNVFGSGHGGIGGEYTQLSFVKNTHVTVDSTALIYGSVFGGGEDGHVRHDTRVDIKGGVIGQEQEDILHGNVYGGGRGLIQSNNLVSPTAGEVFGHTTVNIMKSDRQDANHNYYTPVVWNNVYGGGSRSMVGEYKVVNISDGTVHDHVFGGSRDVPTGRSNKAPRWVNMWGGTVGGNVYGCSHNSIDSTATGGKTDWAAFINLSGGTVRGNVFGGGYGGQIDGVMYDQEKGGIVRGSVAVLIGKNAIEKSNLTVIGNANVHKPATVVKDSLNILGRVYAGADAVQDSTWGKYAVTGYSHIYIDGTGYNTTDTHVANYMNVGNGGIFGSGNNCEAGEAGHNILVRNYGARGTGDEFPVYRTVATIQRCDTLLLDHANLHLSGGNNITNADASATPRKTYGVLNVADALMAANGSGIVLGASQQAVYIDSVLQVRSLYWNGGEGSSVYQHAAVHNNSNWEWIGIQNNDNKLYRIPASGSPVQLTAAQENVIRFNNMSKMWVRTHERMNNSLGVVRDTSVYGELQGFFRLRADSYDPHGEESFAYARPKFTSTDQTEQDENTADGGFLSYRDSHNFFTDGGANYTKTKQYPYINEAVPFPDDPVRGNFTNWRRKWVYPQNSHLWYVDGTRGWGHDILRSIDPDAGRYPDKPKKTITGQTTGGVGSGVVSDISYTPGKFSYFNDHIYVVGALSALDEVGPLCDSVGQDGTHYPLRLYRYPGGHAMSNGKNDYGGGQPTQTEPVNANDWGVQGTENLAYAGPGANYGAMLNVQGGASTGASITLRGVLMDGLNGYSPNEVEFHQIPTASPYTVYDSTQVTMPLVVTHKNATLTLEGGTELMRGYNNTDAATITITQDTTVYTFDNFYTNPDFTGSVTVTVEEEETSTSTSTTYPIINGGALYVDEDATVNVEGLVTITGNKQKLGPSVIESNVYLPTFSKYLNITGTLDAATRIGITSPNRSKKANYVYNTFSPVAVATDPENASAIASAAWTNNNFQDDQQWFFVNGYTPTVSDNPSNGRSTYYADAIADYPNNTGFTPANTLFFGWTWANVVRKEPSAGDLSGEVTDNFSYTDINSAYDLAWLISKSAGMNGQTATDFSSVGTIKQTDDIDLQQYVWVPIGDVTQGKAFAGTYDGQAHLIKNLSIQYIGTGDRRYERLNYGMFGYLKGGKIDRTFVVSGKVKPTIPSTAENVTYNLGGLVGCLANDESVTAMVSNSEAAVDIEFPNMQNGPEINAGGLVATMTSGEIHSSMSMPNINSIYANNNGSVGGLVGSATAGAIRNSFTNAHFGVNYTSDPTIKIGGLLGSNTSARMSNCYMALHTPTGMNLQSSYFGRIAAVNATASNIDSCYAVPYAVEETPLAFVIPSRGSCGDHCLDYTPVITADNLGYMYYDNTVQLAAATPGKAEAKKEALFKQLNRWVKKQNGSGNKYAYWSRPALSEINGDLPVLLINNPVNSSARAGVSAYQGELRSLGTYEGSQGGLALQYGGPVRDGSGDELSTMLGREESVFVYGDVTEDLSSASIAATKVSIHEDVAIQHPWAANYDNTYVGVSFDNSHVNGLATSSAGINHLGMFDLPRDWHMLSTPLSNAPLGFNYMVNGVNTNLSTYYPATPTGNAVNYGDYYNNPWAYYHSHNEADNYEFHWLNPGTEENPTTTGPVRYWMKGWTNSQSQNGHVTDATGEGWVDGYFPSRVANAADNVTGFAYGEGCMENTDEYGRYPYGMDFFCWYEPEPHWINFKRNGPNHWHSDESSTNVHDHLAYTENGVSNQNEDNLVVGKGYMMAICDTTFMQSHGRLNADGQTRAVTATAPTASTSTFAEPYKGWNLIGNPYHAYLDFDLFAGYDGSGNSGDPEGSKDPSVNGILSNIQNGTTPFLVVYDADRYKSADGASSAYLTYPATGSEGGAYAGRYLHPHQGFFVRVNEGGSLSFTEAMTVTRSSLGTGDNDGHFRSGVKINYPLVNLFLSSDKGCTDITVVELERPQLGGAHKMHELRSGNGLFYARLEQQDYAAVFAPEGTERVPIWFEPTEDDIFTISWNTANANFSSLYLVDNLTGVKYDMLLSDRYIFEAHKFDYKSRFYITFSLEEDPEDEPLEGQEIFVFHDGSQWVVTGEGDLEFVDVLGHVLMHTHITGGQSRVTTPRVANGLYFMRLTNGTECKLQKVIVNNQ